MSGAIRRLRESVVAAGWLLVVGALPARAQLRPLDPVPLDVFDGPGLEAQVGAGLYVDQRAALAGESGRLAELGTVRVSWMLERVALEVAGTARRRFLRTGTYADALDRVRDEPDGVRSDVGDVRLSTQVALTARPSPVLVALRFGVRLPTTDDAQGLERDQTDFFSLATVAARRGRWRVGGELGVGVHGTRNPANEQVDVLLFGALAELDLGAVAASVALAGHHDPRAGREFRGNEDLGEARLGVRVGTRRWLALTLSRGWTPTSPDLGVVVSYGMRF